MHTNLYKGTSLKELLFLITTIIIGFLLMFSNNRMYHIIGIAVTVIWGAIFLVIIGELGWKYFFKGKNTGGK